MTRNTNKRWKNSPEDFKFYTSLYYVSIHWKTYKITYMDECN
jgi:hypothetical protein